MEAAQLVPTSGSRIQLPGLDDPFSGNSQPIMYMANNRMPVMIEFSSTIVYIIFAAFILALLFILPGIRRTKLTTCIGLISLLTVGASTLLALRGSDWLTGSVQIDQAPYSSMTRELFSGKLEVKVGLNSANVTLFGKLNEPAEKKDQSVVDYNERFEWNQPSEMQEEHVKALKKGLPYPLLTVTEFFSQDSDGFNWTRQLRQAGHYCSMVLYLALASWILSLVFMCILPIYLPHMMQITGALLMLAVWVYTILIESPKSFSFQIFAGAQMEFVFGSTSAITFGAGILSVVAGLILMAIQMSANNSSEPFTIMDSEQFLNDQKAMYNLNLIRGSAEAVVIDSKPKSESHSVIIPMKDIERIFASAR